MASQLERGWRRAEIETGEDEESRYQQEEFDTIGAVDYILASTSLAEVKARYEQRYKLAAEVKDKDAMKAIIAAKDKMKAALSTEMAGQA